MIELWVAHSREPPKLSQLIFDKSMNIYSRAQRILKPMANYRTLEESHKIPEGMPQLPVLGKNEFPVGAYINDESSFDDCVFFSTESVYVFRHRYWENVRFLDIVKVVMPNSKENINGFNVLDQSQSFFWVPITGSLASKFYDAFEVIRFFDCVINDLRYRATAQNARPIPPPLPPDPA